MTRSKPELVHDALCDFFLVQLTLEDITPAMVKEIVQFLKTQEVKALPVPGSKVGEIRDKTPTTDDDAVPFPRQVG